MVVRTHSPQILLNFLVRPWSGGYHPTASSTAMAPHCISILLYSLVLTVEWRVCRYGVRYGCAPSLPPETAVLFPSDSGVEGMALHGLVRSCSLTSPQYCCILSVGRWRGGYDSAVSGIVVALHPLSF